MTRGFTTSMSLPLPFDMGNSPNLNLGQRVVTEVEAPVCARLPKASEGVETELECISVIYNDAILFGSTATAARQGKKEFCVPMKEWQGCIAHQFRDPTRCFDSILAEKRQVDTSTMLPTRCGAVLRREQRWVHRGDTNSNNVLDSGRPSSAEIRALSDELLHKVGLDRSMVEASNERPSEHGQAEGVVWYDLFSEIQAVVIDDSGVRHRMWSASIPEGASIAVPGA